jgi:hypothetical protein
MSGWQLTPLAPLSLPAPGREIKHAIKILPNAGEKGSLQILRLVGRYS